MTKREMLESLKTAIETLKDLYEKLPVGSDRVMVLNIIRQDIGPVAYQLQNDIEQEEL